MELKKLIYTFIVYTLGITSILLFTKKKKHISFQLLGFYSIVQIICISSYLVILYPNYIYQHIPQLFYIPVPFYFIIIPLFFLFIKYSIYPYYRMRKFWIGHFMPFVIFLLYTMIRYWFKADAYIQELLSSGSSALKTESLFVSILFNFQYLIYSIWLLIELKQVNKNKKLLLNTIFNYHFLKATIYVYVVGCVLSLITFSIYLSRMRLHFDIRFLNLLYFYFFFLFLFYITVKVYNKKDIFKYRNTRSGHHDLIQLYNKITKVMEATQPFVEPSLHLDQFAKSIQENPRIVSQAINHVFGSNFNDFINYYRIELAKRKLDSRPMMTIQEVLFNTGFNSKATFNKVFKDITHQTPTQYRKRL